MPPGLADGDRTVHRRYADKSGAGAKFDALVVVVPSFAALRTHAGAALEGPAPIRFKENTGLKSRRNPNGNGAVGGTRFHARATPGITREGKRDRAVFRMDTLLPAVAFESDRPIVGVEV